jgi:hypothetical protein
VQGAEAGGQIGAWVFQQYSNMHPINSNIVPIRNLEALEHKGTSDPNLQLLQNLATDPRNCQRALLRQAAGANAWRSGDFVTVMVNHAELAPAGGRLPIKVHAMWHGVHVQCALSCAQIEFGEVTLPCSTTVSFVGVDTWVRHVYDRRPSAIACDPPVCSLHVHCTWAQLR